MDTPQRALIGSIIIRPDKEKQEEMFRRWIRKNLDFKAPETSTHLPRCMKYHTELKKMRKVCLNKQIKKHLS